MRRFWFAFGLVAFWTAICIGGAVLLALVAGCGARDRIVERPVIVPKVERCSAPAGARPAWAPIPDPTVCKPGFSCFPRPVAVELADNISRLRAWAAQVDELCAPAKEPVK